ncbi:hypothetical protein EDC39_10817 [Geothermobacter ehrlichii]|uniref:AAA+ ATPase domain-containing protein n=1 Tax=Geothermobacter ehrlichii TaxID=213224 RepID=A0A5D3WKQ8_9BACT|nr:ATP-binding protein [Geothermobacter ehrlichii]TYO98080.1 hypothetical protein EDC39_10817 [Geothermobacter ehrlichii]
MTTTKGKSNLASIVSIAPRFQRAIRIDMDLGKPEALEGFICPQSSINALLGMARHVSQTGQCAFTWTGPYGSGKSSLLVALGALLSNKPQAVAAVAASVGQENVEEILAALPPKKNGWNVLPVVGRRDDPARVIFEAIKNQFGRKVAGEQDLNDGEIIELLFKIAQEKKTTRGGLIVFIDEMGKFLEAAANQNKDIYFFQQLAETASRSNNRLIVIGALHQAFSEYAHRLSREMRDEWSKIQGRFVDLPINVAGEEQLELLSRAISTQKTSTTKEISRQVADIIARNRPGVSESLAQTLEACWPLHPLVACLLGPISRRRFGQNQRSLFGFLNSAEPAGFRYFLERATEDDLYDSDLLWDYLRYNLESAILTSPDGHRWALAAEAVDRCELQVSKGDYSRILKAIALIDMFKGTSGLMASPALLKACFFDLPEAEIDRILEQLRKWSLVIYKKHLGAYAIFAGSDFDIEEAINRARSEIGEVDFDELKELAGIQPILAKRHYHETGALRWLDVSLLPANQLKAKGIDSPLEKGAFGRFVLLVATENETRETLEALCGEVSAKPHDYPVIIGVSKQAWTINALATEILALKKVYEESSELSGDAVARKEIRANLAEAQIQLEAELNKAFDQACWYGPFGKKEVSRPGLSVLASDLADEVFEASPRIHNELLNRIKPSSNAVAAQNNLLRLMVTKEGEPRLGIEGFPAEGGLFASIIEESGLYQGKPPVFHPPTPARDKCHLLPAWTAADDYLKANANRSVALNEVFDLWKDAPYGIKDGLLPVLGVAYILTRRSQLAFYREGIFQSRLTDLDVEILAKNPQAIQVRYMNLSELSKKLLSGMADIVRDLDSVNVLENLEPIDVARGLIAVYDRVHPWAKRTMRLSKDAIRIRNLFKKANDPNKFLFDDIPGLLGKNISAAEEDGIKEVVQFIHNGLKEILSAYPTELARIRDLMLAELQVPNLYPQTLANLRERAENIKDVSGDFRLEAFIVRLAKFKGTEADVEGLASLAVNKPPRSWIDADIDRAKVEIVALAQQFIRMETFARIKGRKDKRQSLAVMVGLNGRPEPLQKDFEVSEEDRAKIDSLVAKIDAAMTADEDENVVLAAVAEFVAKYIEARSLLKKKAVGSS